MLKLLHIENIAVIESCEIEFDRGFNVMTGETGAGKSIVIDSIGAILGERTSRDLVRTGAKKAVASAVFEDISDEIRAWLSDNSFTDEDNNDPNLLIQREIFSDGKNISRVNGRPITVSMLKTLGAMLINIHGQHDGQQLLDSDLHSGFIDRFAANDVYKTVYNDYLNTYNDLQEKISEKMRLCIDESEKTRRIEMLEYQIRELKDADIQPGEDEIISERRRILHNSSRMIDAITLAYTLFSGDEESSGINGAVSEAGNALRHIADTAQSVSTLYDRIEEIKYTCSDISDELRTLLDSFEFSPQQADEIESRFDLLQKLKRKYGSSADEMLEFLKNAENELETIEFSEQRLKLLDSEIESLNEKALILADKLYGVRNEAADIFQKRISDELIQLDMGKVTFCAEITRRDTLNERGNDDIRFLISTNAGEPLKALNKIASGGELARIMLALKNVLAEHDNVETLIFDEVDAGVSGRAAQKVAEKLNQLSRCKQILCVTHLAQISAMADTHFKIEKSDHQGRTYTKVIPLDNDGRAQELARITGGTNITETTLKNAEELLSSARLLKENAIQESAS